MGKQVQKRDACLVGGHILKPQADGVVQAYKAALQRAQHQRHGGHYLGKRAHIVARCVGYAALIPLGQLSMNAGVQYPAPLPGSHGAARKRALADAAQKQLVHCLPHRRSSLITGERPPGIFCCFHYSTDRAPGKGRKSRFPARERAGRSRHRMKRPPFSRGLRRRKEQ